MRAFSLSLLIINAKESSDATLTRCFSFQLDLRSDDDWEMTFWPPMLVWLCYSAGVLTFASEQTVSRDRSLATPSFIRIVSPLTPFLYVALRVRCSCRIPSTLLAEIDAY